MGHRTYGRSCIPLIGSSGYYLAVLAIFSSFSSREVVDGYS
jgi:hypothetical protein